MTDKNNNFLHDHIAWITRFISENHARFNYLQSANSGRFCYSRPDYLVLSEKYGSSYENNAVYSYKAIDYTSGKLVIVADENALDGICMNTLRSAKKIIKVNPSLKYQIILDEYNRQTTR